jgi:hypothetical protein
VKMDHRLIHDCKVQGNALIPIAVYSRMHREILRTRSFEDLVSIRDSIWRDVQMKYSLTTFIRFILDLISDGKLELFFSRLDKAWPDIIPAKQHGHQSDL